MYVDYVYYLIILPLNINRHKEVQKIATKPVYQSSNAHILHSPSQSRSNLEAMKNKYVSTF